MVRQDNLLDEEVAFLAQLSRLALFDAGYEMAPTGNEVVELEATIHLPTGRSDPRFAAYERAVLQLRSVAPPESSLVPLARLYALFPLWLTGQREGYAVVDAPPGSQIRVLSGPAGPALTVLLLPLEALYDGEGTCIVRRMLAARREPQESEVGRRLMRRGRLIAKKLLSTRGVREEYPFDPGFARHATFRLMAPPETSVVPELPEDQTLVNQCWSYRIFAEDDPTPGAFYSLSVIADRLISDEEVPVRNRATVLMGPQISGLRLTLEATLPLIPLVLAASALLALTVGGATEFFAVAAAAVLGGSVLPSPTALWRDSTGPTALAFTDIDRHAYFANLFNIGTLISGTAMFLASGSSQTTLFVVFSGTLVSSFVVGWAYMFRSLLLRQKFLPVPPRPLEPEPPSSDQTIDLRDRLDSEVLGAGT